MDRGNWKLFGNETNSADEARARTATERGAIEAEVKEAIRKVLAITRSTDGRCADTTLRSIAPGKGDGTP
jgi:hypothetical protein